MEADERHAEFTEATDNLEAIYKTPARLLQELCRMKGNAFALCHGRRLATTLVPLCIAMGNLYSSKESLHGIWYNTWQ